LSLPSARRYPGWKLKKADWQAFSTDLDLSSAFSYHSVDEINDNIVVLLKLPKNISHKPHLQPFIIDHTVVELLM
jgi:hypothetical protein